MILYDIKPHLRNLCILDVNEIDEKEFNSLDEYLFLFPKQKKLVYAYLKCCTEPITLSKVHELFKNFDNIFWLLNSAEHQDNINSDNCYANVVSKYIRNPYTWVSSMIYIQPYLFDAKYLLLGRFQEVASKCTYKYMHTQTMHYSGIYNHVRTLDGLQKHNNWFIEKLSIEKEFFSDILNKIKFSSNLRVHTYHKYIEIFDDSSQLVLQFELTDVEVKTRIIFPKGSRQRGRKQNTLIIMKLLSRYSELFHLYNILMNSQNKILEYLSKLVTNNVTHSDTYNRLHSSLVQILTDFKEYATGTYLPNKFIHLYMVQNDAVERISLSTSKQYGRLRIYRAVKLLNDKLNRYDEIDLSSYNMSSKDLSICADELLLSGFINIGHIEERHTLYDYELLATNKSQTFALQFLKLPQITAGKLFEDYDNMQELLNAEIQGMKESGMNAIDTRVKPKHNSTIDTYFEQFALMKDSEIFEEQRKIVYYHKMQLIKKFNRTYKTYIKENENTKNN